MWRFQSWKQPRLSVCNGFRFLASLLRQDASLLWTSFSWFLGLMVISARLQLSILKRSSRILTLCPLDSTFLSGSPYFPSRLCCSVSWFSLLLLLPSSMDKWEELAPQCFCVSPHSGCIFFRPLSEPSTTDVLPVANLPFVSTVHAWTSPDVPA